MREILRGVEKFFILFWVLVVHVYVIVKYHQTENVRMVHLIVCNLYFILKIMLAEISLIKLLLREEP